MPSPTQDILKLLEETLPPCFPRKKVHDLTFGMVNPRTLANRDCNNTGPKERFFVKRETWYQKPQFLEYVKTILADTRNK